MNPVLLKPRGDGESQLVIGGHAVCNVKAGAFYDDHWQRARRAVFESHERLAAEYDLIIAEGAGSIAEINLHEHDLANVETARLADATIVLVADIDRGGAFASLYGTLELMPEDLRDRVAGMVINKFRGDGTILTPGITELEALTNVPVIGVLPHDDPDLPEEDSVSLTDHDRSTPRDRGQCGRDGALTIAVPRLPHISNFTDLEPLGRIPRVRVDYIPLQDSLRAADAVVIPGTKNTVDDLHALTEAGLDEELRRFDGPIVGVCGGYQMLGKRLLNSDIEGTGPDAVVDGVGLLPVETRFSQDKCVRQVEVPVSGTGPIDGASGTATGYEIHMGRTYPLTALAQPLGENSAATSFVLGTYLHGLFENESIWSAFLDVVSREAETSWEKPSTDRPTPYTQAANLVDSIEMACFQPGE